MIRLRRIWPGLASVRVRLTLWYVLLLILILAGFCSFIYVRLASDLYSETDRLQMDEARGLASALQSGDEANLTALLGDVPAGTIAIVMDTTSDRLMESQSGSTQAAAGLRVLPVPPVPDSTLTPVTLAGDATWRLATVPVLVDGQTPWVVRVARSDRDVEAALRQLVTQMAVAVPVIVLVAIASGLFLADRALNPIDAITRAAANIGAQDLGRRLGLRGNDEAGRLAATFDGMLDRLEHAFEQQRQFTANASHELRTPLAMLMSEIDITLERTRSADHYQHALRSMREEVAELSRLVSELLMLARAEAGQEPLAREVMDLGEMMAGVVSSMQPLALARDIQLVAFNGRPAPLEGDQTRLMQLAINLLDNAIKYTPPGGVVTVTTREAPGWAILEVADTGPGIQPEHQQRIFERFFRGDAARTRSTGAGLGLTISQWIAQAHGGDIRVESAPTGGTRFCVRLPAGSVAGTIN